MVKSLKRVWLSIVALLTASVVSLAGCGANPGSAANNESVNSTSSASSKEVTLKVGIMGSDVPLWKFIDEQAKQEGIHLDIVTFNDYVLPNMALAQGELDLNAFQTISYLNTFKKQHHLDLSPIATTYLSPMAVYSKKYKTLKDIPDGAKIAVPNDVTNEARALLLLQEGGLIKLSSNFGLTGTVKQITENPKHLQIVPMVAQNTARVLPDVDASVINGNYAIEAGLNPMKDSIYHEGATAKAYLNVLAVRTQDVNRPELQKLAKIYQSDKVKQFIDQTWPGARIPVFVPVSEIANIGA
jgi:D-methionine transport system substrate-binding protein